MGWYVKLERGVVDRAVFDRHLRAHLDWVRDLQARGHRASTGYWAEAKGRSGNGAGGMLLFQARDRAEAEAIVQADPLILSGCVEWDLHDWHVVGGELRPGPSPESPAASC